MATKRKAAPTPSSGKIEKLTPAQTARIAEFRDRWISIGLSTAPADRAKAVEHIGEAYRAAGLEPPRIVIWLGSPMAGAIGAHMLTQLPSGIGGAQVRAQVWEQVGAQVWDQVRAQVVDQVWTQVGHQVGHQVVDQVRAQVVDQVWTQVGHQVGHQVRDQVRAQVREQVGAQVREQVWEQVGHQVKEQVYRAGYGLHDANWLGFYEFFAEVCGLQDKVKKLVGLLGIGQTCGWWWPFKGAVILTERPCHLARDEQHRLHCEARAAIEYPDGWGVYAWHGTRVPARWILERAKLPADEVLKTENAEQRRAGAEIIGWDKICSQLEATVVDEDPDPEIGTLLNVQLPDEPNAKFIRVRCGTGRMFWLPVPEEMKTAIQAQEWMWDLKPGEYCPEVRT